MRRRRSSPIAEAFDRVAAHVEEANRALVAAMPSARRAGAPIAEALLAFESAIDAARAEMPGWRDERTETAWSRCLAALEDAETKAEKLRLSAPQLDFEGLAMVLGGLIAPLEAFHDAERVVRAAV